MCTRTHARVCVHAYMHACIFFFTKLHVKDDADQGHQRYCINEVCLVIILQKLVFFITPPYIYFCLVYYHADSI